MNGPVQEVQRLRQELAEKTRELAELRAKDAEHAEATKDHGPTHCNCPVPGGKATIAPQGMCERCGIEGPDHQRALQEALAAGRSKAALEEGRFEGQRQGYYAGILEGRQQMLDALVRRELDTPPGPGDYDLEMDA